MNDKVILVAEDDEGHFSLLSKSLRRNGIFNPIVHFREGKDLLDYLFCEDQQDDTQKNSSIVILDLNLSDMYGVELLKLIRHSDLSQIREMPVVIHTSSIDEKEKIECFSLDCDYFITKTPDGLPLAEAVQNLLGSFSSSIQ